MWLPKFLREPWLPTKDLLEFLVHLFAHLAWVTHWLSWTDQGKLAYCVIECCLCIHLRLQQLHILLWHWGWIFNTSRLADKMELTEVSYTHSQNTHRASNTFACDPEPLTKTYLSTVLAQDHFFSDFLSLHLTSKTHKVTMMMLLGVGSRNSNSGWTADLMNHASPPLSEWHWQASLNSQECKHTESVWNGPPMKHVNLPG